MGSFHRKAEKADGTTVGGGFSGDCPGLPLSGCRVVFKLDPKGKETVLHTFTGGADRFGPYGDPLLDAAGDLCGAASNGGDLSGLCSDVVEPAIGFLGCGTVFKLDRTGKFTVLHTFNGARPPATGNFCLGVWEKTRPSKYKLNHLTISWNPDATLQGPGNIREVITLSPDHNS